jgi:DNA primase|tara:strand:- start:285 stop:1124 length:840 start_codon:yes stop_codon:yes gene_type:complete
MIAEDLLREKGIHYELSGKDAKILCLNPEHDDTNPSLRVDRITGIMHCFSCGFKGNLFTHFGAPSSPLEVRLHKLKEKVEKTRSQTVGIQLPKDRLAWKGGGFRNISEETLNIWDAFTWNVPKFEGRIIFPIRDITGKTVALIGRLINGMGSDKYYIYPSGVEMPFCPAKVKPIQNRVILVEGIFDALNLWDKGLKNTVCCFGTQQMNWVKLSLLKMQGVSGIDIMYDGDEAGRTAAEKVKGTAEELGMSVQIVTLPEGTDPGGLVKDQVNRISKRLYG